MGYRDDLELERAAVAINLEEAACVIRREGSRADRQCHLLDSGWK